MKTKLLTLLLCLLTTLPALAIEFEVDGIAYTITGDNTVEVARYYAYHGGSITIPAKVQYEGNTYSVTAIGRSAFYVCTGLTSITLPNSLTSIGDKAFYECTGLTSITLPETLIDMGDKTFYGCTSLTSITLPNSLISIGEWAFSGCTGLTSITLPNSLTSIGNQAFKGCTGLTSITLPNSLTSIGNQAFKGCTGLTSITLPNLLTSIGGATFEGCTGLTSITLPNSLTSIGSSAFSGCTGLTSITLPNSLTSIGDWAFSGCTGLTSITLPNSLTSIDYCAFFGCTGLTSITLPNSLTSISNDAFSYCSSLTQIEVDNANKAYCSIDGVLFNKDKTTIITYPAGKSNQYIIPNSVTSIVDWAFYGCTVLTSITLPNSLTSIGEYAFYNCSQLTEIYCEAEVPPTCYDGTFYDDTLSDVVYANCTLYVPAGAIEAYRKAEVWRQFSNIVGVDNNEVEVPEEPTWQTAVTIEEEAKQWLFVPYVWASSDEAVASVSQTGEVTAVAPGTCTVTFTCGDLVYSCVVTVINKSTGRAEVSSVSPAVAYDLQGRRVSNPHRGIFIVNGRKQRLN